jgi:hypothetical protein
MDLDVPTLVRTVGRAASPPDVEILGPVEAADLALLEIRPATVHRHVELKDRHHSVARLLAAGHKPWEVCAITGYSASHLSIVQDNPAFQELLAFYRQHEDAQSADIAQRVKDAAATAVAKLAERLELDEAIEFGELNKAARDLLDRAGHGPKSTRDVNVTVGLADRVEAARQRAIAARQHSVTQTPAPTGPTLELEVASSPDEA